MHIIIYLHNILYCRNIFSDEVVFRSILSEKLDVSPSRMRMIKLFVILSGALHLSACFFWRVKVRAQNIK
jgi:hypothetical protein